MFGRRDGSAPPPPPPAPHPVVAAETPATYESPALPKEALFKDLETAASVTEKIKAEEAIITQPAAPRADPLQQARLEQARKRIYSDLRDGIDLKAL